MAQGHPGLVLVTGANGYIASRLIPRLLDEGRPVRAAARDPRLLRGRNWTRRVEVVAANSGQPGGLDAAMSGVETAYYLIHNMSSGHGYMQIERQSASRFAAAAEAAGVQHIIYLGGLADPHARNLAPHMRSRIETGEILRQGRVPVTEFRAGVIVGPGSISFEMIRFLTEFFPIMPGPRWLRNRAQPIAADNVIDYLIAALEAREAHAGIYELGGPEQMRYGDTMLRYAQARGLKRRLITLPGIPIWLMARIIDQLTPVPYPIATALVGGLQSDSIVQDDAARRYFPSIELIPYHDALCIALEQLTPSKLERVWEGTSRNAISLKHEGFFIDRRRVEISGDRESAFGIIAGMGGGNGWPYANRLWRLRGWLDRLARRGSAPDRPDARREPIVPGSTQATDPQPKPGDRVDYYTVEAFEPGRLLRLHADLCAPGEGWMEWRVEEAGPETTSLTQTAFFAPRGLPGLLYWTVLGPIHRLVFGGMVAAIKKRSESR